MAIKSVNGSFSLPAVFSAQRGDLNPLSFERYKEAYYSLNMAQREAVFTVNQPQFCAKLNHAYLDLFRIDFAGKSQTGHGVGGVRPSYLVESFDFSGHESLSPKKRITLLNKDIFAEVLQRSPDFLRNIRRARCKCAYLPDIWHKLVDQSPMSWSLLDAILLQVLEFVFLFEFHASSDRPFDRILKLFPSPRDLELGMRSSSVSVSQMEGTPMDEALLDSLNDSLAKPLKAKAKKSKKNRKPQSASTTPSPVSDDEAVCDQLWRNFVLPCQTTDVSISTKNTFLHFDIRTNQRRARAHTTADVIISSL